MIVSPIETAIISEALLGTRIDSLLTVVSGRTKARPPDVLATLCDLIRIDIVKLEESDRRWVVWCETSAYSRLTEMRTETGK